MVLPGNFRGGNGNVGIIRSPVRAIVLPDNRYEAGEEESLRERSSDPLGPEFCVVPPRGAQRSINRGIGGLGIELRKDAIRTPTQLICAEGNMNRGDTASPWLSPA